MSKVKKKLINDNYSSLFPVIIGLAIMPLILRLSTQEYPVELLGFFLRSSTVINIYTHYKSLTIIASAIAATLFIIYLLDTKKVSIKDLYSKPFFLIYGYIIIVILSTIFSKYPFFSFVGYIDRHENVFVLISYVILFIYTAVTLNNVKFFNFLIYAWMISIVIMFLIGISQWQGNSILGADWVKSIIIPSAYMDTYDLNPTSTVITQTFGNPNYVVFYAALAFPFFFVLTLLSKSLKSKVIFAMITGMLIFNATISPSRNGLVGIFVALAIVFLIIQLSKIKFRFIYIGLIFLFGISVISYNIINETSIYKKMLVLFDQLGAQTTYPLKSILTDSDLVIDHERFNIRIVVKEHKTFPFEIIYQNNPLDLSFIDNKYIVVDQLDLPDERFDNLFLTFDINNPYLTVSIDKVNWQFVFTNNQFYFINSLGNLETLGEVKAFGFENNLRFGSSRGYIWSRSIPIALDNWLLGTGPDTYPLVFPQHDRVGKLNGLSINMVVSKPHNILLNYSVNTGIISMLLLLALWIYYAIDSIKLYVGSDFKDSLMIISFASFAGVTGYLASGMVNDTYLAVTTSFWVLLGIGFAANRLIKLDKQTDGKPSEKVIVAIEKKEVVKKNNILVENQTSINNKSVSQQRKKKKKR